MARDYGNVILSLFCMFSEICRMMICGKFLCTLTFANILRFIDILIHIHELLIDR